MSWNPKTLKFGFYNYSNTILMFLQSSIEQYDFIFILFFPAGCFFLTPPASPGGPRLCAPFYTWGSPSLKEVTCRMSIKHTFSATCFTVLAGAGLAPWSKQIDPGLYFDLASFNVNLNFFRLCLRSCKFFCQNFRWNLNFFKN